MSDHGSFLGVLGPQRPSKWAIAAFAASCSFTGGAVVLLLLSWAA